MTISLSANMESIESVERRQWAAAGESVGFGRGSGGGKIMVGSFLLSLACFCRDYTVGIIWREKKSFFPPQVGNIPAEVGKNPTQKRRTIVLGTVVRSQNKIN